MEGFLHHGRVRRADGHEGATVQQMCTNRIASSHSTARPPSHRAPTETKYMGCSGGINAGESTSPHDTAGRRAAQRLCGRQTDGVAVKISFQAKILSRTSSLRMRRFCNRISTTNPTLRRRVDRHERKTNCLASGLHRKPILVPLCSPMSTQR